MDDLTSVSSEEGRARVRLCRDEKFSIFGPIKGKVKVIGE